MAWPENLMGVIVAEIALYCLWLGSGAALVGVCTHLLYQIALDRAQQIKEQADTM